MSESNEIVSGQIAIFKMVMTKTIEAGIIDVVLQLSVYDNVCTDLRQRRIEAEKARSRNAGNNGNGDRPATQGQKDNMDKYNIVYNSDITAKEASDKITKSIEEGKKQG